MPGVQGEGEWGLITNGYRVSLWGDKNVLGLVVTWIVNILKITELYTLKRWILWYGNIPHKAVRIKYLLLTILTTKIFFYYFHFFTEYLLNTCYFKCSSKIKEIQFVFIQKRKKKVFIQRENKSWMKTEELGWVVGKINIDMV